MKLYLILITFILFSLCVQAQEIKKYTSKKGKFAIGFLKSPAMTKKLFSSVRNTYYVGGKDTTLVYNFRTTTYVSKSLNKNNLKYEIGYFDVPSTFSDTLTKAQIYSLFDGMQQIITMRDGRQHTFAENTRLLGSQNLGLLGYYGKEYRWQENNTENYFRKRVYWIKNRVYIISLSTAKDNNFNNDINKYFDSFELLDTPTNPKAEIGITKNEQIFLEAQNFTINFPKVPEAREIKIPITSKILKMVVYELINDDIAYFVRTRQYEKDVTMTKDFNLEVFYNQVIEEILDKEGKIISKKIIDVEGRKAIEVKTSYEKQQMILKQRIILKENVLYFIQVITTPENDENKEMNNFLDSFSLKE